MKTKTFLMGLFLLISSISFAQITITVNPLPTPSIVSQTDPTTCGGTDGEATVDGGVSYSWNTTPEQTTATATALAAGTYICTVTNANGCSETISVTLTDPGAPTPTLSATDEEICAGDEVTFTVAEVADNYNFFINDVSVQDGASDTYVTSALVDGDVVRVEATVGGCMGNSNEITIIVHALPQATFTVDAPDTEICDGDQIDLLVSPFGGLAPYSVEMVTGTGDLVSPNNTNPVINVGTGETARFSVQPTATTTYHYVIVDGRGCVIDTQ